MLLLDVLIADQQVECVLTCGADAAAGWAAALAL